MKTEQTFIEEKIEENEKNESDFLMNICAGTLQTKSGHCGVSMTKPNVICRCRKYCKKDDAYVCTYGLNPLYLINEKNNTIN